MHRVYDPYNPCTHMTSTIHHYRNQTISVKRKKNSTVCRNMRGIIKLLFNVRHVNTVHALLRSIYVWRSLIGWKWSLCSCMGGTLVASTILVWKEITQNWIRWEKEVNNIMNTYLIAIDTFSTKLSYCQWIFFSKMGIFLVKNLTKSSCSICRWLTKYTV